MSDFIKTLQNTDGKTWQEVESKVYDLGEIIQYLKERAEDGNTEVCFIIRDTGDLYIETNDTEIAAAIEGSGFKLAEREVTI